MNNTNVITPPPPVSINYWPERALVYEYPDLTYDGDGDGDYEAQYTNHETTVRRVATHATVEVVKAHRA